MIRGRTIVCLASGYDAPPTSKHHVMHLLARHNTVLWVNYHASRRPSIAAHDLRHLAGRFRRVFRGVRAVRPNLHVMTPLVVPLPGSSAARAVNRFLLTAQIRHALSRLQTGPLQLWSFCPDAGFLLRGLALEKVAYYCVDDFSSFSGYDSRQVLTDEEALCRRADLVIATSRALYQAKGRWSRKVLFVPHGVDYTHFARALSEPLEAPQDIRHLPHPRIGFFGLLRDWIDLDMLAELGRRRPEWQFVIVGDSAVDASSLSLLPNIHLLGARPYGQLPAYCRHLDAGIIPFKINTLTRAVNPIKLREYLAAGLPVVSTPLPEVQAYEGLVEIAADAPAFEAALERVLRGSEGDRLRRSQAMRKETWPRKVHAICRTLMSQAASAPAEVTA